MNRRTFIGLLAAIVAFPKNAIGRCFRARDARWKVLRQQVDGWDCACRYRMLDRQNVEIDWLKMTSDESNWQPRPVIAFQEGWGAPKFVPFGNTGDWNDDGFVVSWSDSFSPKPVWSTG